MVENSLFYFKFRKKAFILLAPTIKIGYKYQDIGLKKRVD